MERPQMIKMKPYLLYIIQNQFHMSKQSTVCPCNICVPFSALNTDLRGYILTSEGTNYN